MRSSNGLVRSCSTAALLAAALLAPRAQAQPAYGPMIDAFCTQQGRTPATPWADLKSATPLSECQLCHLPNTFNSKQVVQPNFNEFKLARQSGDFSFFCAMAAQTNRPPVLAPIGNRSGGVGLPLSISLGATDPDGGMLRFSVAGAPAGMLLTDRGDGTAECSWMPGSNQAGNYNLIFAVADSGTPVASDSEQITLSIGPGNRPPVLDPIGNHGYAPGTLLSIELMASDPDQDRLAFAVNGAPAEAQLDDRGDGTALWSWLPAAGTDSSYELEFTVTDSGVPAADASEAIVLSPEGSNRPPVLAPIGNRRARVGEMLQVSITASDPDADTLAFSARAVPVGASFTDQGGGAAELHWMPAADQVGAVSMVVAVADNGVPAEVDSELFTITVESPPAVPTGDLTLVRALWHARSRRLFALGSGATPREVVSILDAQSGALLGVGRANARGRFRIAIVPFLLPCEVSAQMLGAVSNSLDVEFKPADCGQLPLTRVHELKWKCEDSELRAKAERAPASGEIEVYDEASGLLLDSIPADHRGRVDGRLVLPAAPASVRLSARSGEATWDLGSFPVEDSQAVCGPELEDEDEDEEDDDDEVSGARRR